MLEVSTSDIDSLIDDMTDDEFLEFSLPSLPLEPNFQSVATQLIRNVPPPNTYHSRPVVSEHGLRLFAKEIDSLMDVVAYRDDGCYIYYRGNNTRAPQRVSFAPHVSSSLYTNRHVFLYSYEVAFSTLILDYSKQLVFTPYARFEEACLVGTIYGIFDFCLTKIRDKGYFDSMRITILGTSPDHEVLLNTTLYGVCQAMLDFPINQDNILRKAFLKRIDQQVGDKALCKRMQIVCDELMCARLCQV